MIEYEKGDLIVIVANKLYNTNQTMAIFKSYDSELDQVTLYPLTSRGLELAKFDTDEEQLLMHSTIPFVVTNYSKAQTFIIDTPSLTLDTLQKYYYDQIIARI